MQLNGFKYSKLLYRSIWSIDGILTHTIIPNQSVLGNNDNEGRHLIPQSSGIRTLPSDGLVLYPEQTLGESYCGDLGINSKTPNRILTRRLPNTKCINASLLIRLHASIRLKSEKRKIIKSKVANGKQSRQN